MAHYEYDEFNNAIKYPYCGKSNGLRVSFVISQIVGTNS